MYNLYDLLLHQARIRPSAPFLLTDNKAISYGEMFGRVEVQRAAFGNAGPQAGERVVIACERTDDYVVALFACWGNNATVAPMDANLDRPDGDQILDIAQAHWLLRAGGAAAGEIESQRLRPYDGERWYPGASVPAELLFTSGSSGHPKAVMLSHSTLLSAAVESCDSIKLHGDDVQLTTVPFWHAYGQNRGLISTVYAGASVAVMTENDIGAKLVALKRVDPTVLIAMPSFYGLLGAMKQKRGGRLRVALSGAAPLAPAIGKRFEQAYGVPLLTTYGLTEFPLIACLRLDSQRPIGSVGHPVRGIHLRLVDEDGGDVPAGRHGRVLARGQNVMLGYFGRASKEGNVDGWYDTQDIGWMDPAGALHLVGRDSGFIKRSGLKVYPTEVQNVLMEHASVNDAAVAKHVNAMGEEDLVAYVVVENGSKIESEDLLKYCREKLPSYKVPMKCELVSEIKKLRSGKPDTRSLGGRQNETS